MSIFELFHYMCSLKFEVWPVDPLCLNRAASKPRSNTRNKVAQIHSPKGERMARRLNNPKKIFPL